MTRSFVSTLGVFVTAAVVFGAVVDFFAVFPVPGKAGKAFARGLFCALRLALCIGVALPIVCQARIHKLTVASLAIATITWPAAAFTCSWAVREAAGSHITGVLSARVDSRALTTITSIAVEARTTKLASTEIDATAFRGMAAEIILFAASRGGTLLATARETSVAATFVRPQSCQTQGIF